jgi:hypothetical protein
MLQAVKLMHEPLQLAINLPTTLIEIWGVIGWLGLCRLPCIHELGCPWLG